MFRSARVKLTMFYLATLVAFSLTMTIGIRGFAEYEFNKSFEAQQGEFRQMARNGLSLLMPHPEDDFADAQTYHTQIARQNLTKDLALLNLGALIVGGLVSYWFAGRTLRPIAETHEAQARFVSDASHELRTPLANIRTENEVFLRAHTRAASFNPDETRELIQSNLEEVQRLERLSSDLLALGQYSQYGQASLPKEPVSVDAVIQEAILQTDKSLKAKAVRIEQQLAAGMVYGNHESLVRLIIILLDNAVKYGSKHSLGHGLKGSSEECTIYIAGARHAMSYVITLRDEGPGIDAKDAPHIFDRLYRGDTARTSAANTPTGYGLGLALAKEIVQAHDGSIRTYNSPQGGAVFSLQLPLSR